MQWPQTLIQGSGAKLPKLVALQIFQSSYLSCGESWKHYIYHKEDTKVGSQKLATKFGFVPDW